MNGHVMRRTKCEEGLAAATSSFFRSCVIAKGCLLIVTLLVITLPGTILAYEKRLEHLVTQQEASPSRDEVVVYHAGSLNAVISEDIGPGFTSATGFPVTNISGPSVDLANQIRSRQIQPDVFMSADAEVNHVLMGRENGEVAPWYFPQAVRQRPRVRRLGT